MLQVTSFKFQEVDYNIDAKNKILGRLAVEIAVTLRGKNSANFESSVLPRNKVTIFNTDKIRVSGKKMGQKIYYRHSGYIGNLKKRKLEEQMARDSRVVLREAVLGMLPKNKSRHKIIKNLILFKEEK